MLLLTRSLVSIFLFNFIKTIPVWNSFLLAPLKSLTADLSASMQKDIDANALMAHVIQGFVGMAEVHLTASLTLTMGIVSRLSSKRAGTRFNARGMYHI